jgi:hypothetical protein
VQEKKKKNKMLSNRTMESFSVRKFLRTFFGDMYRKQLQKTKKTLTNNSTTTEKLTTFILQQHATQKQTHPQNNYEAGKCHEGI